MTAAPRNRWPVVLAMAGIASWVTFAVVMAGAYAQTPPGAGFDLELLLTGGRRVAEGLSPYEPSMLAGSPSASRRCSSLPPLVARAFAPFAGVPSVVMLAAAVIVAATLAAVAASIVRLSSDRVTHRQALLIVLATLPFWFPYTLGMLFGNFDLLFVAFYGLVLLAVVPAPVATLGRRRGIAVAVATLTSCTRRSSGSGCSPAACASCATGSRGFPSRAGAAAELGGRARRGGRGSSSSP